MAALVAALLVLLLARTGVAAPRRSTAGAPVGPVIERPTGALRSCDPLAPVCVHATSAVPVEALATARVAFSIAWSLVVDTLRVPRPLPDGARGGDPRLDVYLVARGTKVPRMLDGLAVGRDPLDLLADRDAASAFLVVDEEAVRAGSCALAAIAARGVVRASTMGLDVAESEVVVDGFARRIAEVVAPCPELERPAFAELQARPWRAITASPAGPHLVARTLDVQRGSGFGAIVPGVLSMAGNHHGIVVPAEDDELGPAHFHDDPSVFDVLASSLSDAGSSLDAMFLDVAVARATAPVAPAWEWTVPVSTLPRRFAVRRGIEPTGMTFVRVELDVAPAGDAVEMDLAWEGGSRFAWRVLKLDAAGRVVSEVPVPPLETTRKITIEARHLSGVRTILLCGVNLGDPGRPWRPTEPPSPAHGYDLGIFAGS
ncbi:MAG: hypothetical protein HYV09_19720 [Deltaproteobacteria bacterium]|nr:hypothetical protein [Deltaproteobacteria bacterium]